MKIELSGYAISDFFESLSDQKKEGFKNWDEIIMNPKLNLLKANKLGCDIEGHVDINGRSKKLIIHGDPKATIKGLKEAGKDTAIIGKILERYLNSIK